VRQVLLGSVIEVAGRRPLRMRVVQAVPTQEALAALQAQRLLAVEAYPRAARSAHLAPSTEALDRRVEVVLVERQVAVRQVAVPPEPLRWLLAARAVPPALGPQKVA